MASKKKADDEAIDFASRRLCPDGSCIGVIGADGRCKVCGKAGEGPVVAVEPGLADAGGDDEDETDEDQDDRSAEDEGLGPCAERRVGCDDQDDDGEHAPAAGAPAWDDRELCPDGSCIGVIGPNGRCKECGRPAGNARS